MSAKKAEDKKAAAPAAEAAEAAKPAESASPKDKPEEALANALIAELDRVHVRIPRY
ncbi:MAG: hypothetical protein LBO66_00975 [Deltaproteobacteria bacterium]|jgi:hypothetical protein|nr:hypothetical protein [Deltaproteobacteria bacterium]